MTPRTEVIVAALPRERARVASDLLALTKPRVVLMVLITTVVGYYVGLAGAPDYGRLAALLLGTALAAGGTLAPNQYWERDVDARMARTRTRPLPEGRLAPLEALLFGILFLWQLPHTLAIAQLYREDYARAGVRLLPVIDAQGRATERQILSGTLALLAVSLLPTLIGLAGGIYFAGALVLGAGFVVLGAQQALAPSLSRARRVLLASLLYLPVLLALLAFDKA